MDEGVQGLYILGTMAILFSLLWHSLLKNYKNAVIGATVTTVVFFQVAATIHIGYIDPFIFIAMFVSGIITAIVASAIGLPFKTKRKISGNGS